MENQSFHRQFYFAVLACVAILLLEAVLLNRYCLPTLVQLFEGASLQLPWPTQAVVALHHWLQTPAPWFVFLCLAYAAWKFPSRQDLRVWSAWLAPAALLLQAFLTGLVVWALSLPFYQISGDLG